MIEAWTLLEGLSLHPSPLAPCPGSTELAEVWPLLLGVVPDAWVIGLPIALLIIQVVLVIVQSVIVWKVGEIRDLKRELTTATEKAITERFSGVMQDIAEINQRLLRGETSFNELREADARLKVEVVERLADLKSTVMERCAGKDDVNELKQMLMRRGIND